MEVWTCQVDQINAPNRHVAIPNQFGYHMASVSLQSVQERSVTYSFLMFFVSLLYLLQAKNLKLKITLDYKSPQVQRAQACLRKVSLQRKMNILFMIIISAENGLAAPDSANTQLGSSSNFKDPTKIEYVLDWPSVVKKYYNVIKNVPTES